MMSVTPRLTLLLGILLAAAAAFVVPRPGIATTTALAARPADCPAEVWERVVEAERTSREKKFGAMGAALGAFGLDKAAIEANQLRIWDELKRKRAEAPGGPKKKKNKQQQQPAEPVPKTASSGPFAGMREAFQKVYDEADQMGYAQAVALSASLENKGLLPKVVTAQQNATSVGATTLATSGEAEEMGKSATSSREPRQRRRPPKSKKSRQKGFGA